MTTLRGCRGGLAAGMAVLALMLGACSSGANDDVEARASSSPIELPTAWESVGTLAELHEIVTRAVGSADPAAAAGSIGTFPTTLPFPEGAVLAGLQVDATNLRVRAPRDQHEAPIENRVEVTVEVPADIDDVQDFYTERLAAAGYETSDVGRSMGVTDLATVRGLGYREIGDEPGGARDVQLLIDFRQFNDEAFTTLRIAHTLSTGGETLDQPVASGFDDAPVPPDYQLATARLTLINRASDLVVGYAADYHNNERALGAGLQFFGDQLPIGAWSRPPDSREGAFDDQRFVQIAYDGLGEGRVATVLRGGNSFTVLELSVETELEKPASLAPFDRDQ